MSSMDRSPALFFSIALAATVLIAGCDMTRTLDPDERDHDPKLVLQERFQPGQPWEVTVSRSVGAFEPGRVTEEQFDVTDATVEVFRGDTKLGTLSRDSLNRYSTTAFTPSPGVAYTVRASAPEMETVEATDQIPPLPPARLSAENTDSTQRTLELTIDDPRAADNYYEIVLEERVDRDSLGPIRDRISFETQSQAILNEMGESLEIGEENTYRGSEAVFTDGLFDGQSYTINLRVHNRGSRFHDAVEGVTFILQLRTLSEDTYQYLSTRRLAQRTGDNPFASPVDVEGNVEGGYGLVGARNVDTLRYRVSGGDQ